VSIRVVKDHLGYSRGFAYVDYRTEEEAGKAVKGEPLEIKGRRLYIALSRPPV
jgi:RNA recognition motif-containing protein